MPFHSGYRANVGNSEGSDGEIETCEENVLNVARLVRAMKLEAKMHS